MLRRLARAAARKIAFWRLDRSAVRRLNLCCGPQKIPGYLGIDFDHPLIGRQGVAYDVNADTFRRELSRARTFGFMRDLEKMRARNGLLTMTDEGRLQWACLDCWNAERRRAAT